MIKFFSDDQQIKKNQSERLIFSIFHFCTIDLSQNSIEKKVLNR